MANKINYNDPAIIQDLVQRVVDAEDLKKTKIGDEGGMVYLLFGRCFLAPLVHIESPRETEGAQSYIELINQYIEQTGRLAESRGMSLVALDSLHKRIEPFTKHHYESMGIGICVVENGDQIEQFAALINDLKTNLHDSYSKLESRSRGIKSDNEDIF